jgi:hypothetical protein
MHFSCHERQKKEKTQIINNRWQSSHDMGEGMSAHLSRRQMIRFDHR